MFPYKRTFLNPHKLWSTAQTVDGYKFSDQFVIPRLSDSDLYTSIDVLTDYFTEYARVRAHRRGYISPFDFFTKYTDKVRQTAKELASRDNFKGPKEFYLRESLYQWTRRNECSNFRLSLAKEIYRHFGSKKVLDPSTGWGDRLLGAAAAGVEIYHGVDPNNELVSGHREIIQFIRMGYKVTCEDFLTYNVDDVYDTVFTSPPFYNYEIYTGESFAETREEWKSTFMKRYIQKAWSHVAPGGHLILYMPGDLIPDDTVVPKPKRYKVIGTTVPLWVWKKN